MADYIPDWSLGGGAEKHGYLYWVRLGRAMVPPWMEFRYAGQKGAPDVVARFEVRDGVPETTFFQATAKENGRAVRTADLDQFFPVERLAATVYRQVGRVRHSDPETGEYKGSTMPRDEREEWMLRADIEDAQASSRGPSRAELEVVAQVYRDAIQGRPTGAVQVNLGYSRRTAARRVQQARAAGLLPPTTPGKKRATDDED